MLVLRGAFRPRKEAAVNIWLPVGQSRRDLIGEDIYPPCRDELIRRGWALVHDPSLTGAYLVTNQRPLSKRQRDFLYGYFKDMGMTGRAELYQKEDGSGMLPARGIEE